MSAPRRPVAVIDIGSNSGRVVILELDRAGYLRVLAGSRAPLRLVHDVDEKQRLTEESMARAMVAVRDFHAIAVSAGASRIVAVATAALRDAKNGQLLIDRIRRELGIRVDLIGGRDEARYGFAGAVRGLPVSSGVWFDLGGGSLQVSHFAHRRLGRAVSLPLGALRLSEKFLESDPPKARELRRLREHVRKHLKRARVERVRRHESLVGTGGTLRNLAKIDRSTRYYPISTLHGYVLSLESVHDVVRRLAARKESRRDDIEGLSAERADSIVGGAVAIETLMEYVGASEILVSGQGVREGVALGLLRMTVAPSKRLKEASLTSLASRFDGWRADAAERRRKLAASLVRALDPSAERRVVEAIDHGARLLDIGRSLDFFDRHEHTADMLLSTELDGFSHEEIAFISGLIRLAGNRHADPEMLSPLIDRSDRHAIDRGAVILALADEIERRCPRGRKIDVSCRVGREVAISVPALPAWRSRDLGQRFERVFGKTLVIKTK